MIKNIFITLSALVVFLGCAVAPINQKMVHEKWGLNGTYEETTTIRQDSLGKSWTFYTSDAYGFQEIFISYSDTSGMNEVQPYYTAVPSDPNYHYNFKINDQDELEITRINMGYGQRKYYQRDLYNPNEEEFIIPLEDIFYDLDKDGLSDYSEYTVFTDPYNKDTDGDGKPDGDDQNPLAAPNDTLSITEDLHKYIIERQMELYQTRKLLIVEQFNHVPMEYERENGLVLSLSPEECDEFINTFGYGIPILTATVKDTMDQFLVNYQLFIEPTVSFGFDAIYDWSSSWNQWVRQRTLYNWEAAE